jgi:hypothetical protein
MSNSREITSRKLYMDALISKIDKAFRPFIENQNPDNETYAIKLRFTSHEIDEQDGHNLILELMDRGYSVSIANEELTVYYKFIG